LEEEGAGIEGEVEGTEVVVEVVEAEAEGVDGGGEGAQLGHRSHHRRILSVQHYMGIQFNFPVAATETLIKVWNLEDL